VSERGSRSKCATGSEIPAQLAKAATSPMKWMAFGVAMERFWALQSPRTREVNQ
jgi:hypothetical protein